MSNLDDVKAGKYELIAVSWDRITSKPGQPLEFIRHRQGEVVDLDVEQARRLLRANAVVKQGERQRAAVAAAQAQLQAALAAVPPELREQVQADVQPPKPEPSVPPKAPAKQ